MERIQLKQQNARFLEMIRNTHANWEQDKEPSKIVKKREKTLKKFQNTLGTLGKGSQSFPMKNCLPNLKKQLMEKSPLNNPTADKSQDLAEECRKALEQSYGCPIPLPKLFGQKSKSKFSKNQNNRP